MKKSTLLSVCVFLLGFGSLKAQTTILEEDFEGGSMPTGWSQTTNADDGGWLFGTATDLSSSSFPIPTHTNIVATNDDACDCDKSNDILMSTTVDLSSYTYVYLSFSSFFYHGYYDAQENAYVQVSTDAGSNWTTAKTLGGAGSWSMEYVDLSAYAGNTSVMIAFKYDDGGGWNFGWAIDDVKVYEPIAGPDISVSGVHVGTNDPTPTFVDYPLSLPDWSMEVHASLFNKGTEAVTSFDFTWSDGVNTYTQSFSGIDIEPLASYDIVADDNYVVETGSHDITAEFSNINGGDYDPDQLDNTGIFSIEGVTPNPDKVYLIEERTGTWCGWCVRGIVFMDYMRATYPDNFIGIAVHNGDPMKNTTYDTGMGAYANYFPSAVADRVDVIDPSQVEQNYLSRISLVPPVKLSASATFNQSSNQLSVHVDGNFTQDLSGDYRFNAILVEDSVTGTTTSYDQTNYYSINDYGYAGPMAGFEDMPGDISHSDIYYMQVGRSFLSNPATFKGQASSLPTTIDSGATYGYDFTYTVPSTFNINHCHVVVTANAYSSDDILNAGLTQIEIATGVQNIPANASLFIYPNPASDVAVVNAIIPQPVKVKLEVFNSLGQLMTNNNYGTISGNHNFNLNVTDLSSGIYDVRVTAGDQVYSKKLVVGQ